MMAAKQISIIFMYDMIDRQHFMKYKRSKIRFYYINEMEKSSLNLYESMTLPLLYI